MSTKIKLTKNSYRLEKQRLRHLQVFLPTLKLKKALLQAEVQSAVRDVEIKMQKYKQLRESVYSFSELFSISTYVDVKAACKIQSIQKSIENISGVEVPVVHEVVLSKVSYSLLDTPIWLDTLIDSYREFAVSKIFAEVAQERLRILQKELRSVSIRVNLFEKKLIPDTIQMIKKIAIFLSDRSITDVGQVKMAKKKIQKRKEVASCAST